MTFPTKGMPRKEVMAALEQKGVNDADWHKGKVFGYVYNAGDEIVELQKEVYNRFGMTNALNPMAFPSLKECEAEVLSMTASLLNNPDAKGTMTTGGTESICMAVKTARQWARACRKESAPEMILPVTAHPAFHKAAHYFDVKPVLAPIKSDLTVDIQAVRLAVNEHTVLIVGSAPNFPYGVIDSIPDLAKLARDNGILCHVDACMGGFFLPFVERMGRKVPPWDFRVEGVTSMSADLHKYGYAAKGASTVLYSTPELRKHQFFVHTDWPGGLYGSPSMTGARGGGPIASAWATVKFLGEDGYMRLSGDAMEATDRIVEGIRGIEELEVMGEPVMSLVAFTSETADVYVIGELMAQKGWHLDQLLMPKALHMTVSPVHKTVVDPFLRDLAEITKKVVAEGTVAEGAAAMYGMLATLPDRGQVNEFILSFLDSMY